ncbi:MAG: hypothetical protein EOP32_11995 [Rhodococcus sp. (in: high G+C Gram-positive bacteria)]|nr:MAG: hypothetical protein EOP32_11995 [Rhodococcus sp. (in: high G+C Gram-positive bacteria)]
MSWDLDRVLAAVADVERVQDDVEPKPLAGSDYERVVLAARRAEARVGIAADGPALPTYDEVQAERQRHARERYEAERHPEPASDPNIEAHHALQELKRQRERDLYRDDVAELQPYRTGEFPQLP